MDAVVIANIAFMGYSAMITSFMLRWKNPFLLVLGSISVTSAYAIVFLLAFRHPITIASSICYGVSLVTWADYVFNGFK